jgi:hypothetical protein
VRVDDLYPVRLFVGGEQLARVRVLSRDGRVKVYADTGTRVELVREGELIGWQRVNGSEWTFTVERDGGVEEWTVRRVGGCGCGSRLKRLDVDKAWAAT